MIIDIFILYKEKIVYEIKRFNIKINLISCLNYFIINYQNYI